MAKGDRDSQQNNINTYGGRAQTGLTASNNYVNANNQQFQNNYARGSNQAFNDYNSIMGDYNRFLSGSSFGTPSSNYGPPQQQQQYRAQPGPVTRNPNIYGSGQVNNGLGNIYSSGINPDGSQGTGWSDPRNNSGYLGGRMTTQGGNQDGFYYNEVGARIPNAPSNAPPQNFGNLQDPNTWMGLVRNPQQLDAWLQSVAPNMPADLRNYYAGKIQGQPGANPTEQAGSAQYWTDKIRSDPKSGSGASGNMSYPGAIQSGLGGYSDILNSSGGNYGNVIGQYANFAETGGLSDRDRQDLRARGIAPIRSQYAQNRAELNRSRALNGGYSPNYAATMAQMSRDESYNNADAMQNVNAQIAQLVQQGRLAGMGGELAGLSGMYGTQLGASGGLSQTGLLGQGQNLSAIQGKSNLYGTSPGLAGTFGNQLLGSQQNATNSQALNNNLQLGLIGAGQNATGIPSDFQSGESNVGNLLNLIGTGANIIPGLSGIPGLGSNNNASKPSVTTNPGLGEYIGGGGYYPPGSPYDPGEGGNYPNPVPNPYPPGDPNGPLPPSPGPFSKNRRMSLFA